MDLTRKPTALALAVALAFSGAAFASGSTPTMQDALEASPNRLTAQESADLERRATSGESAREAPEGTYSPIAGGETSSYGGAVTPNAGTSTTNTTDPTSTRGQGNQPAPRSETQRATPAMPATPATPAEPGVRPAIPADPATPAVPADKADSRDDAVRTDVAPRDRKVPAERPKG